MHEMNFKLTSFGVIGILPDGEEMEFATEAEYIDKYHEVENEIYDEMAEYYSEYPDYPEDWAC